MDLSQIKRHEVRHHMRERLEQGLNTKISSENKGFQLLLKLGFK